MKYASFSQFSIRAARLSMLLILFMPVHIAHAQTHPDLSGIWMPQWGGPDAVGPPPAESLFNDFAQGLYDTYAAAYTPADGPGGFCIKPGLPRSVFGVSYPIEIMQNERFITIFWEGYFQYRKIYMEGYDRPEPILHTGMGYSVGRWEGETLVVETSFLREYLHMTNTPNTNDATTVERISIEIRPDRNGVDKAFLVNDFIMVDPALYREPVVKQGLMMSSPDTPIMEYSCSEGIYDNYVEERGLPIPDFTKK